MGAEPDGNTNHGQPRRRPRRRRRRRLHPLSVPGPVIALVELTKRFKDFTAVDSLSLEVAPAEIFGLLGPNGSGKTTTLNVISGLSKPTSGSVRVLGHDVVADPLPAEPFDLDRLSASLEALLKDEPLRRRMGEAGRTFALGRFDGKVMVDALEEVYRQCPHGAG